MNTNQLKRFAQEARIKLIDQIGAKLEKVLTSDSVALREKAGHLKKLQEAINKTSKTEVIDTVAYTWFNRFVALRFMDVNGYEPLGISIVSPIEGGTLPAILQEAKQGSIPEELPVQQQRIYDVLDGRIPSTDAQNEAYAALLVGACNHLSKTLPFLFEKIDDYAELLLPDDLISQFSILQDVRNGMTAEDCIDVEIIGWLYQFYISEKKDEVFSSDSKVKKEDIPAATQLFTPRWIVEYMVQNTIGKLWMQNNPKSKLRDHMPYFIESPSVTTDDYLKIKSVEDITLLDQACGSGHILVYGFELLSKIYEEQGYNESEIPKLIIEKNLHGFEIDTRAAQLSGLALMLKARQYYRRVFKKDIIPNIYCYKDLQINEEDIRATFASVDEALSDALLYDLKTMQQATNLGSLIIPHTSEKDLEKTRASLATKVNTSDLFHTHNLRSILQAIVQLCGLSQKYHCVVDNPPYMGSRKMDDFLKQWTRVNYPQAYQDLFSCFIVRADTQLLKGGLAGFITLQGWMFVSSFTEFREWLLDNVNFDSLVQVGGNSFPSLNSQVARAVTFIMTNRSSQGIDTISYDLDSVEKSHSINKQVLFEDYIKKGKYSSRSFELFKNVNRYTFLHSIDSELLEKFINSKPFEKTAKPKQGLATGSNERFVRFWQEINYNKSYWYSNSDSKWYPYNKGGDYRKWYGNNENVVNWENDGLEIKNFKDSKGKLRSRPQNESYYFKKGVTYSLIGNSNFCARSYGDGFIFDVGGSGFFPEEKDYYFLLGLVNSRVGSYLLSRLNPTVNFQVGDIGNIPIIDASESHKKKVDETVQENIELLQDEWSEKEEHPDFFQIEIFKIKTNDELQESVQSVVLRRKLKINRLFKNVFNLDAIFCEMYGIQSKLFQSKFKLSIYGTLVMSKPLEESDISISWEREVMEDFVSYAIGCMFGRYSLDKPGLILANQGETLETYLENLKVSNSKFKTFEDLTFVPDDDNVIPILDNEWFEDDIVNRFYAFLKATFGKQNFDKNLAFVEDSVGDIRKYFLKTFYTDHVKRYKKRPIYWLFSSPSGAFNALIYMHRYTPDTLNTMLNGYLKEYQEKLKAQDTQLEHVKNVGTDREKVSAEKEQARISKVLIELQEYDRELFKIATERIAIDLDDGVLVNYNKFGAVIKPVVGLNDKKTKKKVKEFDWIDVTEIQ